MKSAKELAEQIVRIAEMAIKRVSADVVASFPDENRQLHYVSDTLEEIQAALKKVDAQIPLI